MSVRLFCYYYLYILRLIKLLNVVFWTGWTRFVWSGKIDTFSQNKANILNSNNDYSGIFNRLDKVIFRLYHNSTINYEVVKFCLWNYDRFQPDKHVTYTIFLLWIIKCFLISSKLLYDYFIYIHAHHIRTTHFYHIFMLSKWKLKCWMHTFDLIYKRCLTSSLQFNSDRVTVNCFQNYNLCIKFDTNDSIQ